MNSPKRRFVRFAPDPNTLALIDFEFDFKKEFKPTLYGLVIEEAQKGCSIVVVNVSELKLEAERPCRIQVGKLAPMKALIKWIKPGEDAVSRMGFMYLE